MRLKGFVAIRSETKEEWSSELEVMRMRMMMVVAWWMIPPPMHAYKLSLSAWIREFNGFGLISGFYLVWINPVCHHHHPLLHGCEDPPTVILIWDSLQAHYMHVVWCDVWCFDVDGAQTSPSIKEWGWQAATAISNWVICFKVDLHCALRCFHE